MKFVFNSFFVLYCSFSSCLAGTGDEFLKDWMSSITVLKNLNTKIQRLQTDDHELYFGKRGISEEQIEKTKLVFSIAEKQTTDKLKNALSDGKGIFSSTDNEEISILAFQLSCAALPLIKNIYNEKLKYLNSPYAKDLEECLEFVSFFYKHFTDIGNNMKSFLIVKEINSYHDLKCFREYLVYFDKKDLLIKQRRQLSYALYRLDQMNLNELALPIEYQKCLESDIMERKEALKTALGILSLQIHKCPSVSKKRYKNLSKFVTTEDAMKLRSLVDNQRVIDINLYICSNPFNLTFLNNSDLKKIALTIEEQRTSAELLRKMLEEKQLLALTSSSMPYDSAGQTFKRKNQLGKRKKGESRSSMKRASGKPRETAQDSTSSTSSTIKTIQEKVVTSSHLGISEAVFSSDMPSSCDSSAMPSSCDSSAMSTSSSSYDSSVMPSSSSSCDSIVRENDLAFLNQWLTDIIKVSQSNDETFIIFQKAEKLKSMLAENHDLLEQTQEAVVGLAERLLMLQGAFLKCAVFHEVPQSSESFFSYLMDTPIRYLKGLRFRLVESFFNTLGIKINKSAAGSRIHFSFRDAQSHHETSIHLHDKHNGELDGGRISSLRKFLIDCGFGYGEAQSLPVQKPTHRRR